MITNAELTIFNAFPDAELKRILYIPHHVAHVWFYVDQKINVSNGGLSSADMYKIRIPYEECGGWIPSNDFRDLAKTEGKWTIQNGDLFIMGKWIGEDKVGGIEDIRKEFSGMIGKVLSHSENFFGSSPHIRIGGGEQWPRSS